MLGFVDILARAGVRARACVYACGDLYALGVRVACADAWRAWMGGAGVRGGGVRGVARERERDERERGGVHRWV